MNNITLTNEKIINIVKESLPTLLKEKFGSSYSNPLSNALDEILESEEVKKELKRVIFEVYEEIKTEVDFKTLVRESLINNVINELQKNNR